MDYNQIKRRERAEGRAEGRAEIVKAVIPEFIKLGLSIEEAWSKVGITVEKYYETVNS